MTRFKDGPTVEVSVDIDAPIDVVWDLVTDINVASRFQDEFVEAEWIDDGPTLEARFIGRNTRGEREWETTSWVVSYEPHKAFGWAVSNRDNPGATWTYLLDRTDSGTLLRYHRVLGPGPSGLTAAIDRNPEAEEEIISARDEQQRQNMQAVVDGIKELAEL
jgi:hypothetical protein